jgi:hypothetical protein
VKQPLMFKRLLSVWMAMPKMLERGIERGCAAREPRPKWVPLQGLSPISDLLPPQAYADPGWAEVYNNAIQKFRRRVAFSAFWSGISKAELEARLETYALLMKANKGVSSPEDQRLHACAAMYNDITPLPHSSDI